MSSGKDDTMTENKVVAQSVHSEVERDNQIKASDQHKNLEKLLQKLENMLFDELLKILGELGKYQKIRLFLICLVSVVCAFHALNMVFVGAKPKYECALDDVNLTSLSNPDAFENVTRSDWNELIRKAKKGCQIYQADEIFNAIDSGMSFEDVKKLENVTKKDCTSWEYATDVYGSTIVTQFNLVCDKDWLRSFSKTLYFFGRLLGAVVFGQLSDIFGRKPMFFVGLFMLLIVGCVAAASPVMYVFIPFYILQGAAQTGLFLVAFTMCTELVGPKYRLLAGFLIQGFYSIGYMLLSLLSYLIRDWRYIELAITLPVVLFAVYWWFLTESVRWLLSKNRFDDAKVIIRKVAEVNEVTVSDDMLENLTDKKEAEPQLSKKYTFIDLLRPLPMFLMSINIWFNWIINAMVYYGLSLGTDNLGGDPYINFMIAGAVEIPAYTLCVLFLNRLGRRWPLFGTMVVGGIACIISGFVPADYVAVKVLFAMIGKFGITASYAIIYLMAAELFPTVVRNIGMGVSSMSARIGGMLAPQILELNRFWEPLPLILFGGLSILAGTLALLLSETAGRPLPQTIEEALANKSKSIKLNTDDQEMTNANGKFTKKEEL